LACRYNNNTHSWLEEAVHDINATIAEDARADAALWHTGDYDAGVRALLGQIAQRRTQLYQQLVV
jgi:hypothetical protein